jgi:hypothetical protein
MKTGGSLRRSATGCYGPIQTNPRPAELGPRAGSSLSLEGGELKAKSGVLHCDGCMPAEQEWRETKQEQDEGWHEA